MQYREFDCLAIVAGRGSVDDENCSQKNRRLRSRSTFLWRLPTFSRTGWQSRLASFDAIKPLGLSSTPGLLSCSTRLVNQVAPPIWPGDLQCGRFFSEKAYAEADNDASNPDDVEELLSYVLNCTPCHSDEYSSHFFSCHSRYWNKSGCMFLKFDCDIKQFHRNIKQFHFSIEEMENTTMKFHPSIQKAPFYPLCGVSCGTYPIHVLICRYTTWS